MTIKIIIKISRHIKLEVTVMGLIMGLICKFVLYLRNPSDIIEKAITYKFQNIEGIFNSLTGKSFEGYEIHMGITRCNESVKKI